MGMGGAEAKGACHWFVLGPCSFTSLPFKGATAALPMEAGASSLDTLTPFKERKYRYGGGRRAGQSDWPAVFLL